MNRTDGPEWYPGAVTRRPLLILAVAALICVVAGLFLVTVMVSATRRERATSCASNIRQLWSMQNIYAIQFGGPSKAMPDLTGSAFWKALSTTQPPILDPTLLELYLCPVKNRETIGGIDYYGPGAPVGLLKGGDVIGCDAPGNHPEGGNALRKSGDVLEIAPGDYNALLRGPNAPKP